MAPQWRATIDDLPADLLYSSRKLWCERTAEGTVVVGVTLPVLSSNPPTIYWVELNQQDGFVRGDPCVTLDVDAGRLSLPAPISGTVVRHNEALLHDPESLPLDPFGDGWLFELADVPPEELAELMDRSRFWDYLSLERDAHRLELRPTLTAHQDWSESSSWHARMRVRYGGIVVIESHLLRSGRNKVFTPQWHLGQNWIVESKTTQGSISRVSEEFAHPKAITTRWRYEVVETQAETKGKPCYVVKVVETDGPQPQSHLLLHIGRETFALVLIETVSAFDSRRRSRISNDWGCETYLELRRPTELIVDHPLFPEENRDECRTIEVADEPGFTQSTAFPDAYTMHITCSAQLADTMLQSEQVWERGAPWWKQASRLRGDDVVMTARLVETVP